MKTWRQSWRSASSELSGFNRLLKLVWKVLTELQLLTWSGRMKQRRPS